ncbi:MAG: hypothetical protein ACRDTG_13550 [Pseudonocardiaceae bacterium]
METDPGAGLLTAWGAGDLTGFVPVPADSPDPPLKLAGVPLPGWVVDGVTARGHTSWYHLEDPAQPVVITISGSSVRAAAWSPSSAGPRPWTARHRFPLRSPPLRLPLFRWALSC